MKTPRRVLLKRLRIVAMLLAAAFLVVTIIINVTVDRYGSNLTYTDIARIPHRHVTMVLGTSPLNRYNRTNSYFKQRILTAARLYHGGKTDCLIVSGDNHRHGYDEPTAMKDSLIALGVPASRIFCDYAGFRTLDSVVRAKKIFGCDSMTIVSQADHSARALWLARHNEIDAIAIAAPLSAGRKTRYKNKLREWLARDKMMLDILTGRKPHFLGEKINIPAQ